MFSLFRPRVAATRLASVRPTTRYLTYKTPSARDEASSEAKIDSKNDLHPRRKEATGSGTNDEIAAQNSAYNPNTTNPVAEKSETGAEVGCYTPTIAAVSSLSSTTTTTSTAELSATGAGQEGVDAYDHPDYSKVEWPPHFGTSIHIGSFFNIYGV